MKLLIYDDDCVILAVAETDGVAQMMRHTFSLDGVSIIDVPYYSGKYIAGLNELKLFLVELNTQDKSVKYAGHSSNINALQWSKGKMEKFHYAKPDTFIYYGFHANVEDAIRRAQELC